MSSSESLVYIFDVDGTLTREWWNTESRIPYLKANEPIVNIAKSLYEAGSTVAIVTARPEYLKSHTELWLRNQRVKYDFLSHRSAEDERPDYKVRLDQVRDVIKKYGSKVMLFDDKESNCREVSKAGILCVKVNTPSFRP